jgi:hypothetical protein
MLASVQSCTQNVTHVRYSQWCGGWRRGFSFSGKRAKVKGKKGIVDNSGCKGILSRIKTHILLSIRI